MQTWILCKTKLETFKKTHPYHVGTAVILGGPNLARKCIETGRIFPCGSRANPYTQFKVVPDISTVCVHFSTCPKLKQRNMNYRDQKTVVNVLLMDRVLLLALGCHFKTTDTQTYYTSGSMLRKGLGLQQQSTLWSGFPSWDLISNIFKQECLPGCQR